MALLEAVDRESGTTGWIKERKEKEKNSRVKARLVAGCLVITLPVDVRRELGIEVDDQISIETDKENGKITLSLLEKKGE